MPYGPNAKCDARCPATHVVIAVKGRLDLAFCGHHANAYELTLISTGWNFAVDNRPKP